MGKTNISNITKSERQRDTVVFFSALPTGEVVTSPHQSDGEHQDRQRTPRAGGRENTDGPLAGEKLPTQPTLFEAARENMMINLQRLNIWLKQSTSKLQRRFENFPKNFQNSPRKIKLSEATPQKTLISQGALQYCIFFIHQS